MKNIVVLCLGMAFAFLTAMFGSSAAFAADTSVCQAECSKCASVCEKTLSYCKKQGGKHTDSAHIKKLEDCIQMCKTSTDFMKRGSEEQSKVCGLCADLCTKCADSCDAIKDAKMKECADECRKCSDHCTKMSS